MKRRWNRIMTPVLIFVLLVSVLSLAVLVQNSLAVSDDYFTYYTLTVPPVEGVTIYVTGSGVQKGVDDDTYRIIANSRVVISAVNESQLFGIWTMTGAVSLDPTSQAQAQTSFLMTGNCTLSCSTQTIESGQQGVSFSKAYILDESADFDSFIKIVNEYSGLTLADFQRFDSGITSFDSTTSANFRKAYYKLAKNITFTPSGTELGSGITISNSESIGSINKPFTGCFDGQGYTLSFSLLKETGFSSNSIDCFGPFGYISTATNIPACIRSLKTVGTITATSARSTYVGGIAGYIGTGVLLIDLDSNVSVASKVTNAGDAYAGGIAGYSASPLPDSAKNCYNQIAGELSAESALGDAYVGGAFGVLSNAYIREMNVNVLNTELVARADGQTVDANGNVTAIAAPDKARAYAGGIVGRFDTATEPIRSAMHNCTLTSADGFIILARGRHFSSGGGLAGELVEPTGGQISVCNNKVYAQWLNGAINPAATAVGIIRGQDYNENSLGDSRAGGIYGTLTNGANTIYIQSDSPGDYFQGKITVEARANGNTVAYAGGIAGYGIYAADNLVIDISKLTIRARGMNTSTGTKALYAAGLTGYVYDAVPNIDNLTIKGSETTIEVVRESGSQAVGPGYAGGVFGLKNGGSITNTKVYLMNSFITCALNSYEAVAAGTGDIHAYAGGIVGRMHDKGASINPLLQDCTVAGLDDNGQVVGSTLQIRAIQNSAAVTTYEYATKAAGFAGGVAGYAALSTVSRCRYIGDYDNELGTGVSIIYTESNKNGEYPGAGGIVGYARSAQILNCKSSHANICCSAIISTIEVSEAANAGGIAGAAGVESSIAVLISECLSEENRISANGQMNMYACSGGIIGQVCSTPAPNINKSVSSKNKISAYTGAGSFAVGGGIVGFQQNSGLSISNCMSSDDTIFTKTISGERVSVGGIVGSLWGRERKLEVDVTHCYSNAILATEGGGNSYKGGIVGYNYDTPDKWHIRVTYCAYNRQNSAGSTVVADNKHYIDEDYNKIIGFNSNGKPIYDDNQVRETSVDFANFRLDDNAPSTTKYMGLAESLISVENNVCDVSAYGVPNQYYWTFSRKTPPTTEAGSVVVDVRPFPVTGTFPFNDTNDTRFHLGSTPAVVVYAGVAPVNTRVFATKLKADGTDDVVLTSNGLPSGSSISGEFTIYVSSNISNAITFKGTTMDDGQDLVNWQFTRNDSTFAADNQIYPAALSNIVTIEEIDSQVRIVPDVTIASDQYFYMRAVDNFGGSTIPSQYIKINIKPAYITDFSVYVDSAIGDINYGQDGTSAKPFYIRQGGTLQLNSTVTPNDPTATLQTAAYVRSDGTTQLTVESRGALLANATASGTFTVTGTTDGVNAIGQHLTKLVYVQVIASKAVSTVLNGAYFEGPGISLLHGLADYDFYTCATPGYGGAPTVTVTYANSIGNQATLVDTVVTAGSPTKYYYTITALANSGAPTITVTFKRIHMVAFQWQDAAGTLEIVSVLENNPIGVTGFPAPPTRTGYTFTNWYFIPEAATLEAYGDIVSSGTVVSHSFSAYARWQYNVTYVDASGLDVAPVSTIASPLDGTAPLNDTMPLVFTAASSTPLVNPPFVEVKVGDKVLSEAEYSVVANEASTVFTFTVQAALINEYIQGSVHSGITVTPSMRTKSIAYIPEEKPNSEITGNITTRDGIFTIAYAMNHVNKPEDSLVTFAFQDGYKNTNKDVKISFLKGETPVSQALPVGTTLTLQYRVIIDNSTVQRSVWQYDVTAANTSEVLLSTFYKIGETPLFSTQTYDGFTDGATTVEETFYFVCTLPNGDSTLAPASDYSVSVGFLSNGILIPNSDLAVDFEVVERRNSVLTMGSLTASNITPTGAAGSSVTVNQGIAKNAQPYDIRHLFKAFGIVVYLEKDGMIIPLPAGTELTYGTVGKVINVDQPQYKCYFSAPIIYAARNLTLNFAAVDSAAQLAPGIYTIQIDLMEANVTGKYGSGEKRAGVQAELTISS
jgi:hypothetical protein